jgi:cation-transporting ATPase 13A3/4/5
MCFDKTGTLTQDTLQMSGVVELRSAESRELLEQATHCVSELRTPWLRQALACCHSVALIDSTSTPDEPQLIGDPLDIELLKFSGARVSEHVDASNGVRMQHVLVDEQVFSIEQRFEFCSVRRRSSVIVASNQIRRVFCKGAPESIVAQCVTDSYPSDIFERVAEFTARGSRVLAIATKPLKDSHFDAGTDSETIRSACESSLQFLGLLMLENRLKAATVGAIAELNSARIRSVMCTGDHVLTAVAVARSAGIIDAETGIFVASLKNNRVEWHLSSDASVSLDPDTLKPMHTELHSSTVMPFDRFELAVTGDVFEHLYVKWQEDLSMRQVNDTQIGLSSPFHRVLMGTAIFARMTPSQKALAVTEFQHCGLYVGACGDGGNDSLMLRCAHMGVSLSESDASIAAPFTCTQPDISCIPTLLKEGRSSLVTSFQLFRFMALYSTIQFFAVILLYFVGTVLGNYQYLFQDLAVVFPCTVLMGMSPASAELTIKRPSGNLLSVRNLVTTLCHMCICFGFQFMVFYATFNEPTFVDLSTEEQVPLTWHTTTLYYLSNLQYLVMAALMCLGLPWKQAHRNYQVGFFLLFVCFHPPHFNSLHAQFIGWYCLSLIFCLLLLFAPHSSTFFFTVDEVDLPGHLRSFIFGCAILNALLCTAFELWLTPLIVRYLKHRETSGVESVLGAGRSGKVCHLLRQEFESGWLNQIRPRVVEISVDDDPLPM